MEDFWFRGVVCLSVIAILSCVRWAYLEFVLEKTKHERDHYKTEWDKSWGQHVEANNELHRVKQLIADLNREANPEDDEEE
jgi:hypothetical protein